MDDKIKLSKMDGKEVRCNMYLKLRKIRIDRDIPVSKLCEVIKLKTESAYYKKESGAIKFSLIEAKDIADFLGLSIEDIFFDFELSEMDEKQAG